MDAKKILIIEDDRQIVELLKIHFNDHQYITRVAFDGLEGLSLFEAEPFDLIILDLMLPGMDGIELCRRIRQKNSKVSILMLTAKVEEFDKVLGLEMGADDYMIKPFSIRELLARIKALLRRLQPEPININNILITKENISYEGLNIDFDKRRVILHNQQLDLSPKEFELLALLASNPGKSFKREQLLNLIWGMDFAGFEHTVNSHINRLRAKIEPDMQVPKYILTTWGIGYRFNDEL